MKKRNIIFLLLLCFSLLVKAQTTVDDFRTNLPTIIPSPPDVTAFQRYGDMSVGYYSGSAGIGIPIHTITTNSGLSVPISINYNSTGIKVDEKASRVGLGWSMNPGGSISKQIIGIIDNNDNDFPDVLSFDPNNYYTNYTQYEYAKNISEGVADSGYDIYNYNFLGKSGKFFIDHSDNVHLIPHDNLLIEKINDVQIKITDDKGNIYQFYSGGRSKVDSDCPPSSVEEADPLIANNALIDLKLSKIITYRGEEINFTYTIFNYTYTLSIDETDYLVSDSFINDGCGNKSKKTCTKTVTHTEPVISEITFKDQKVKFNYSDNVSYKIENSNLRKDFPDNHALRNIKVFYKTIEVKNFEFNYGYFHSGEYNNDENAFRLKLDEIKQNYIKSHKFTYNETVNLPSRLDHAQDLWGYYNGKISNISLLPTITYGNEVFTGSDRSVSPTHTQANVLTKIEYPTHGSSEFTYENNTYYDSGISNNKIVGGLRLLKLENNDGVEAIERHFEYQKSNSTNSSGIVQGEPQMYSLIEVYDGQGLSLFCKYLTRNASSIYPIALASGNAVGYSHVTEYTKSKIENGRTEYKYTNNFYGFPAGALSRLTNKTTDENYKNGLLLSKTIFNNVNDTIYSEINEYEYYDDMFDQNADDYYYDDKIAAGLTLATHTPEKSGTVVTPAIFDWNYYFNSSAWIKLNKSTKREQGITTTTNYFYDNDSHLQLTRKRTEDSEGNLIEQKTQFPQDLITRSIAEQQLIDNHRISTPIVMESYKDLDDDGIIEGEEILVTKNIEYEIWDNGISDPEFLQTAKGPNSLKNRLTYHDYDDYGNLLEISKSAGTHIVYIWGYNHSKPIAKIENASYSDIPQTTMDGLQGLSVIDIDSISEETLRTALGNLRNLTVLSNSQVTTYTYDPLVGVTSITDPSGYTSYYDYDDFNRLQYIKNKDSEILEQYNYNYALEELSIGSISAPSSVNVNDNINITADINGGSGNYSYQWTVPGVSNLPNSNQISFQALSSHVPSVTATCTVTDTQIQESITFTKQVIVTQTYPPLSTGSVVASDYTVTVGDNVNYSIIVSGGSGNYNYKWVKTNSQNTITLSNGSSSSITANVILDDCSEFEISCEVTDTITNENITKTTQILVTSGCSGGFPGGF